MNGVHVPVKTAKGAKGSCDRYWQRIIKRDQTCERCGMGGSRFDAAHIIPRRFAKTRTDERNGWCLCPTCHYKVDNFADEHQALVERTIGTLVYDELKQIALDTRRKMDWDSERDRLRELCRELAA